MRATVLLVLPLAAAVMNGCHRAPVVKNGEGLLRQADNAMFALKGYRAVCLGTLAAPDNPNIYEFSSLTAQKPLLMRYEKWLSHDPFKGNELPRARATTIYSSDAQTELLQHRNSYAFAPVLTSERLYAGIEPWRGFFSKRWSILRKLADYRAGGYTVRIEYGGAEDFEGALCDKVSVRMEGLVQGMHSGINEVYYLGQADHLAHRLVGREIYGKSWVGFDFALRNIEPNPSVDLASYKCVVPTGATMMKWLIGAGMPGGPHLAEGTPAPDFSVSTAQGSKVTLSSLRGKVVVLVFWATWCDPCFASLAQAEDVAKKTLHANLPVVFVALDDGETRPMFERWVAANGAKYRNLTFAYSDPTRNVSVDLYNVTLIPSQYVIDKHGIIGKEMTGYRRDELADAIKDAARR